MRTGRRDRANILTAKRDSAEKAEPPAAGLRSLLADGDFRSGWIIGICSGIVRWLELLAFGIYVFDLTGSALMVATFTFLRFLPFPFFGAVTGALVDRLGHRNVLVYSLAAMTVSSSILALLALTDNLELWHLAVAAILGGIYWTTDFPARRNLLGQLAGPGMLARAMSFDTASNTMTRALGPLTGGALMAVMGINGILVLTFGLYLIAVISALRLTTLSQSVAVVQSDLLRGIIDGFRFAVTRRNLMAVFAITVIYNLFGFPFTALIPVVGKDTLGLGPDGVGMLAALEGGGAIIGALIVGRTRSLGQVWATYTIGVLTALIGIVIMGAGDQIFTVGAGVVIAGLGGGSFAASQITLTFRLSPPEQRSRMLGILAICIGTAPIGFVVLGYMADLLGSGAALPIMAGEGFVAMILFWLIFRRDLATDAA